MYEAFYGLTARAFQLTPDAAFFFESLTHRKALSYLSYGLNQGEGFIVITGEVGAGKSTLVAHLMATIDPGHLTVAQVVTSALSPDEIVHVAAQAFGLVIDGHDKASALAAIEGLLHAEARNGRRCLLVVDEAQNLSVDAIEELRMLSNFQLGAQPLLQTLLLGQPEFRNLLQSSPALEQLRQRVIAVHHLEAMNAEEVQPYVEHRLRRAGWTGRPAIDAPVFARLHAASGGLPRRINQIAHRLLEAGAEGRCETLDLSLIESVLARMGSDTAMLSPSSGGDGDAEAQSMMQRPLGADHLAQFQAALSQRDAEIADLRKTLRDLAHQLDQQRAAASGVGQSDDVAALTLRLETLEERLVEQEATVRHTLAMLIEWLEAEPTTAA